MTTTFEQQSLNHHLIPTHIWNEKQAKRHFHCTYPNNREGPIYWLRLKRWWQ